MLGPRRILLSFLLLCALASGGLGAQSLGHPRRIDRNDLPAIGRQKLTARATRDSSSIYRLPDDTIPESYALELTSNIHAGDFSYSGTVVVTIRVLRTTHAVVLHSFRNTLTSVVIRNANQLNIPILALEEDPERETLTIRTDSEMLQGTYQVTISFQNQLREDTSGFYRISYTVDGQQRYGALTQFQPVDARTTFPCYDEPGFRASFTVTITSGIETKVYSNMPAAATTIVDGMKRTRFQRTPNMPTYLLAFAITTDFVSKRLTLQAPPSTISMELVAPPTATENALTYGLTLGADIIRIVEDQFNQSYELPKLTQLAVPRMYFSAMENWGLVTYYEPFLLYDEATGTNRDKENVIATIVHEFVHQFLGNLLTPHWWSDISLSEGFATFYEYYLSSTIAPDIRFTEMFTIEAVQVALYLDGDINGRPISSPVETRTDIERIFDKISYQKGGSVFRMFHHALGERAFVKGIRHYVNTNKGRSVTPDDLFASLQVAAREEAVLPLSFDVATVMRPWIYQSGYPLVTVTLQDGELTFYQEHFLYPDADTVSNRTWWIPITCHVEANGSSQGKQLWIPQGTSQVSMEEDLNLPEDGFILVNPMQTGYYRVNYDVDLWERLIRQLNVNHMAIPATSRGQLIDDSFKLYLSDRIDATVLFSLLQFTGTETDVLPWRVALATDNIGVLQGALVADESAYAGFSRFFAAQLRNVWTQVGFDESPTDPHEWQQFRIDLIEWSCRLGLSECRSEALSRMLNDLDGTVPLPSYLKNSVYCGGATIATPAQLDLLSLRLDTISDPREREMIINTLACSENTDYLDALLDSLFVRNYLPGEWQTVLSAVYTKSAYGYSAFSRWLVRDSLQILQNFATDPAFLDIAADVTLRRSEIDRFYELIQLFQQFV